MCGKQSEMRFFYDHQTDVLSISVGDLADYGSSVEITDGVTLHVDGQGRPLAAEIHGARTMVDTTSLPSFEEHAIAEEEVARRLARSEGGRLLWSALSAASADTGVS
jgi:uncharacterized protein YuzE